jgi:hypothetical protein
MKTQNYVIEQIDLDQVTYTDMRQMLDTSPAMMWTAYRITLIGEDGLRLNGYDLVLLATNGRAGFCAGGDTEWVEDGVDYRIESNRRAFVARQMF